MDKVKNENCRNQSRYTRNTSPWDTRSGKIPKTGTIIERPSTHNYNTISRTNSVNHVTTFKNAPNFFQWNRQKNNTSQRLRLTCLHRPQKRYNHSGTNGKPNPLWNYRVSIGYRDLVKIDEPLWTNSMCNELGILYQGYKKHTVTDTIEYILHKDKPKDIRVIYVRSVCDIIPQQKETHRTRFTVGVDRIDYPG